MIYVEESGGLKIEFKFMDAFEQVAEYINDNKAVIEDGISTEKLAI